ncbi:MAG: DUF2974 domain-containing protein [Clostridiales bacterium]|jgi:hypothetical protein|nr:DUF2974 domain-containing protein [Clostridiales bacterium]
MAYDQSAEISAVLDELVYVIPPPGTDPSNSPTVRELVDGLTVSNESQQSIKDRLTEIIKNNPAIGEMRMADNSWVNDGYGTDRKDGGMYAATFVSGDGDVYVAYRGTGHGNWTYNAAAIGYGEDSDIQVYAKDYFEKTMKEVGKAKRDLYVTGHSQGGNNAMYVALFASGAENIKRCYSFDGQGFSEEVIERAKRDRGQGFYDSQTGKMYGFYGENDYVHQQGEKHPMPGNHVTFVKTPEATVKNPGAFHDMIFMLNDHGLQPQGEEGNLAKIVNIIVEKMNKLPPDRKYEAAIAMMAVMEISIGEGFSDELTSEGLEKFKDELSIILIEIIDENPELVANTLKDLFGFDNAFLWAIKPILNEFNQLDRDNRIDALKDVLKVLTETGFDKSKIDIAGALGNTWPLFLEAVFRNPAQVVTLMYEFRVDKMIVTWIKENPGKFIAATVIVTVGIVALAVFAPWVLAAGVTVGLFLGDIMQAIDNVVHWAQEIREFGEKFMEVLTKICGFIKNLYENIRNWIKENLDKGYRYCEDNPYIKADTGRLRDLQTRVTRINNKLRELDREMDTLYFQVGIIDLFTILTANYLTGGSASLTAAARWMGNTATALEQVENKATSLLGG